MGKKEEKQLLDIVGTGPGAGDKEKLLRLFYPKQRVSQAASALEREDVKNLRLTIDISHVIDVNLVRAECGSTPLILSCLNGHHDLALLLIQHGADVNREDLSGNTALHWAAFHDRQDFVDTLIKGKVKPNIANRDGETPLHFIVKKMQVGQPLTMVRLLQGGANAGSKNSSGDTPLTLAARLNKIDAVSLLVDSCRQLAQDARPLIEAARTGRLELSEVLLDCGLDPNGMDKNTGSRPLHEAVQFCRPKICKLLLEFGADSMMKDSKGNTAESLARMLPGNRGPEYLRIFDKGRLLEPRTPRVEKDRVSKIKEAKEKEVTENLPRMAMFTQWTRNVRPYRSRSDPMAVVFNLFDGNARTRYVIPRGRNNWVTFDFGSKFILNGVEVKGWNSDETVKNFQIQHGPSAEGPWHLARAFRATRSDEMQVFQNFVSVSQFVKFVIIDNYSEDVECKTSFISLSFFGLDAEFKTLFGNIGLTKYDQDFIAAGYSTIASLIFLAPGDIQEIIQNDKHSKLLIDTLKNLRSTYQYGKNINMWWKNQPVSKCTAGQVIPPFSLFVDSGVEQIFSLGVEGGATLSGETCVMSRCNTYDRSKAAVVTFKGIALNPPGVYRLVVNDPKAKSTSLYAYRTIEVGK
eukprot:scpid51507/ scgid5723/ Ankyrin repeat and SAM domain-containing protein 1A; Odin